MSARNARLLFRPENILAILGTGVLSVAVFGLIAGSFGASFPFAGELTSFVVGSVAGAKVVRAAAEPLFARPKH